MNTKSKIVAVTGKMFGIMDQKQFEAMMTRFGAAENITVSCSDGECLLPESGAEKLKIARGAVPLQTKSPMHDIVMRVKEEGELLFTAATGRSHLVEATEERLRTRVF